MKNKKENLEKEILESDYTYSVLVYKFIHQDIFKNSIIKIDNIGVPCNVNPKDITSASQQFLRLLNRFIEYFDNTFYFLHTDSFLYIQEIIETNYDELETYLLSKHYLGDNNYMNFFNDSIYRIFVTNFVNSLSLSKGLRNLFKKEGIPIKSIKTYTLDEIIKIKNLLSDIVLANSKNSFKSLILFEDIEKNISHIIQNMKKDKVNEKELSSRKKSIINFSVCKIDSLIEEYEKKKEYLIFLK